MSKQNTTKQNTEDFKIITHEGLKAIRLRPGQYAGSVKSQNGKNPRALIQLAQEVLSNSLDEARAGFGTLIKMTIHQDNSMTVEDEGRGIPMGDPKNKDKYDFVRRAFTVMNSSGKFDSTMYSASGGTHGKGNKIANALSEYILIEVNNIKQHNYKLKFHMEDLLENSFRVSKKDEPTFTKVTFLPSIDVFDTIDWDINELKRRISMASYLSPGVTLVLTDERITPNEEEGIVNSWKYLAPNGIKDLVSYHAAGENQVGLKEPVQFTGTSKVTSKSGTYNIGVDISFTYVESMTSQILAYSNGIPNADFGPHVESFLSETLKIFTEYAQEKKLLKKGHKLNQSDIQDGLIAVISVSIPGDILQFESQTKEKLGTAEVIPAVKEVLDQTLTKWLYDNEKISKLIIEKMIDAKSVREKAAQIRKDAQAARKAKKSGTGKLFVSSKYKAATSSDPKHKELFVTEGQSASGNLNETRYTKYQGVFPLRGKILNVYGVSLARALENQEISTLVSVLGAGVGRDFDPKKLEYDKILLASDADSDGAQIRALLVNLFANLFPGLIEEGHLYFVETPLFVAKKYVKGQLHTKLAYTNNELNEMQESGEIDKSYDITRLKGLGESGPEETKEFLIDPETRHLRRLTMNDMDAAKDALRILMGNDASLRAKWIAEEVDLDKYQ